MKPSSEIPSASIVSTRKGQSSSRPKGVLVPQISAIRCGPMPSMTGARYPGRDTQKQMRLDPDDPGEI